MPPSSIQSELNKAEILALLNAEQYEQALQQSLDFLQADAENPDALYVTGLSYLLGKQFEQSIHHLQQAINIETGNPVYLANLGIAFLRAGDAEQAIQFLQQAIALKPDYDLACYNLGSALIEHRQAEAAVETFTRLVERHPDNPEYRCALADAVRETGQWVKSIRLYQQVLKLQPEHARAHTNMGPLMMHTGQLDDAVMHCLRAIELEPAQTLARKNLGDCYVQMERLEDAMEAYADAYELDEDNAGLCVAIGNVWLETGEPAEAASWFHRASMLEEDCIPAHCGLANIEREQNRLPEALARLQPLYEQQPENIELLLTLSDIHWDDGDAQSALNHLYTVQKLQPQRTALYAKIGHILASAGDVDGAKARYREALQQQPQCIPALSGYATTVKGKLDSAHVEQMETLLHNPKLKPGALASLHNGLAFYYDGKKDFSRAAEHMAQANRLQWQHKQIRGWEHDTVQYENHISRLIETFTPDYFQRVEGLGNNSERPVFIVAMPRSGTTLTEQILARHKNVLGIGERNFATQSLNRYTGNKAAQNISPASFNALNGKQVQALAQDWLDRLDRLAQQSGKADIRRIVDKMPDNYSLVGWILTLFPNARIIHLKRDPRDVALSCWMTQFGAIRWACHTEHLIHRIQQYQRIMQHWREVLPGRFLEIDYEQLVASQEKESRRLVDYLGLPWDENCLTFYESDRLVRTASITQVRQPVYRKSVARWKAYRELIPALFEPLS